MLPYRTLAILLVSHCLASACLAATCGYVTTSDGQTTMAWRLPAIALQLHPNLSDDQRSGILGGVESWNETGIGPTLVATDSQYVPFGRDGLNGIMHVSNISPDASEADFELEEGISGYAFCRWADGDTEPAITVDCDIVFFDANLGGWSYDGFPGLLQYDFPSAAVHELGHLLGLGHPGGDFLLGTSVMKDSQRTGTRRRNPTGFDIGCLTDHYSGVELVAECLEGTVVSCGSDIGACVLGQSTCSDGTWSDDCVGEVRAIQEICDDSIDNDCDDVVDEYCGPNCPADADCTGLTCGPDPICGESCGDCLAPPGDYCSDSYTARTYQVLGTCLATSCDYTFNDIYCPTGCSGGVCDGGSCGAEGDMCCGGANCDPGLACELGTCAVEMAVSLVSAEPGGAYAHPMCPGEEELFVFQYENVGLEAWVDDAGLGVGEQFAADLRSVNIYGDQVDSFLYDEDDVYVLTSWIDRQRVKWLDSTPVVPGGVGTFTFLGEVPIGTAPGPVPVYFRPFAAGVPLDTWSGDHVTIEVLDCAQIPIIEITYPLGGEVFTQEDSVDVTWTSQHVPSDVYVRFYKGPLGDCTDAVVVPVQAPGPNTGLLQDVVLAAADFPAGPDWYLCVDDGVTGSSTGYVTIDPLVAGDVDGDGYSTPADCNDSDPTIHPGAIEVCGDGVDNDCDGTEPACAPPKYLVCYTPDVLVDSNEVAVETEDVHFWNGNPIGTALPGTGEVCFDLVGDVVDTVKINARFYEQLTYSELWMAYMVGPIPTTRGVLTVDGVVVVPTVISWGLVGADAFFVLPAATFRLDDDGDGSANEDDCAPQNAAVRPGIPEVCGDGVDNDCSGGDSGCGVGLVDVCWNAGGASFAEGELYLESSRFSYWGPGNPAASVLNWGTDMCASVSVESGDDIKVNGWFDWSGGAFQEGLAYNSYCDFIGFKGQMTIGGVLALVRTAPTSPTDWLIDPCGTGGDALILVP